MNEYNKILEIADNEQVKLAESFKDLLHKELCLGQTRYLCRFGTLSDGHWKITPAQRYYQAIREMWNIGNTIRQQKAQALEAQADLLDANELLKDAEQVGKQSSILRAKSKVMLSKERLVQSLVMVEDLMRQLDEYDQVRKELGPEIQAKYPHGIEQAEIDNWIAVSKYLAMKKDCGYDAELTHIPLPIEIKAAIGIDTQKPEMAAWLAVAEEEAILKLADGDVKKYLEFGIEHRKKIDGKVS